jgi:hypothetical protein
MKVSNHKAQAGGFNAAILIAIVAGLIMLYIMFLPSGDREDLLDDDDTSSDVTEDDRVLLLESVGQLAVGENLEDRKDIPNVFLFETTNAKELAKENPFIVRRGWFDKQEKEMNFALSDLANTQNTFLSFTIREQKGILTIQLNGNTIFEGEITSANVDPIKLDKSLLKEQNTILFKVSPVGLKFWRTNLYSLENIKVIGDITDRTKQESQNIFTLTESEHESLEEAEVQFVPYCSSESKVGVLDIFVNNRNIFSAVPVCEDPYKQVIPSGVLNKGQNTVVFKTNKGSYSVEQVFIDFEYEQTEAKTYYFELNETKFNDIRDSNDPVTLTLEFVDDNEDKRGIIDVNGRIRSFDQEIEQDDSDKFLSMDITTLIQRGNNYVRIEPETELNIVELKVEWREDS